MGKFNEYSQKATPADNDTLMIYDAAAKANKLSPFSGIWNWIVGKLTNAVISNLQTSNKSVIGALNELNSNRLIEHIKHGQTKEIAFDNDYGCLMFVYHPYFGVGLYGFCTYDNTNVILVTTILEQPQNSISLSLKGRTLKITSKEDSAFCIFKSTFY